MIMEMSSITASVLGLAMVLSTLPGAQAGEIKVLAGGSLTAILGELTPRFEHTIGRRLVIAFGSTPDLIKTVTSGAPFDLGIVPVDVMQDAAARARFASGLPTNIARVGFGVAVRAGASKPDISTPEAFKQTLLKAQSIAYLPDSAAGAYVQRVFERLGIAGAMKAKTKPQKAPTLIAQAVANGEAELGVFLTNVLIAPGVELVGPFPAALQQDLVFTAALAADTAEADVVKAFVDYLGTPEAAAVIKAKGMVPG
jgi:molybdate transport system substrate-binding protein